MAETKKKPALYEEGSILGEAERAADPYLNAMDKFFAEKLRRNPEVKKGVPGGEDPVLDKTKPPYNALPGKDFKPTITPSIAPEEAAALKEVVRIRMADVPKEVRARAISEFGDAPVVQSPEAPPTMDESLREYRADEMKKAAKKIGSGL